MYTINDILYIAKLLNIDIEIFMKSDLAKLEKILLQALILNLNMAL